MLRNPQTPQNPHSKPKTPGLRRTWSSTPAVPTFGWPRCCARHFERRWVPPGMRGLNKEDYVLTRGFPSLYSFPLLLLLRFVFPILLYSLLNKGSVRFWDFKAYYGFWFLTLSHCWGWEAWANSGIGTICDDARLIVPISV